LGSVRPGYNDPGPAFLSELKLGAVSAGARSRCAAT